MGLVCTTGCGQDHNQCHIDGVTELFFELKTHKRQKKGGEWSQLHFSRATNGEIMWRKNISWHCEACFAFILQFERAVTHTCTHIATTMKRKVLCHDNNFIKSHKNYSFRNLSRWLKWETFGCGSEKNPFNDRYWVLTPTSKSNSPSSRKSTSMCISVQPHREEKKKSKKRKSARVSGGGKKQHCIMLILLIDLWGLLNLVRIFLQHIFHNVIRCASITLAVAYTHSRWLTPFIDPRVK